MINEFSMLEMQNNKGMAVLSYVGILALLPYIKEKDNKYVMFHANQGLNLFILYIIFNFVVNFIGGFIIGFIGEIFNIHFNFGLEFISLPVSILFLVLQIMGIVNVINCTPKELPIIKNIKIIK